MQLVLFAILSLAACASAYVEVQSFADYHRKVAIPLAAKIKAAEDAILANKNTNARIVGGNVANPSDHTYMGGLLITYVTNPNTGVCGSALVTPRQLVTAAHCWRDAQDQARRFVVVLGSKYLFSGGERIPTWKVVTYPGWEPTTRHNNLAVIHLNKPIRLTPSIQPIALASNVNETFVGAWAVAAGFGVTSDEQSHINVLSVLHEVRKQVISNQQCRSVYGAIVQDNSLCTNGTGGVGTCWGDGGGPLVAKKNGTAVLIGVATFSAVRGCEKGYPSGFSRISSFYNFIKSQLD